MSKTSEIGLIASLHRYPVKSMMGEELPATRIGAKGLEGDRVFALADTETGKIASAKNPSKWPNFFQFHAAFTGPLNGSGHLPPVQITFPDGTTGLTADPNIDMRLSSGLGRTVHLLSHAPQTGKLEEFWPDVEGLANRMVVTDEKIPEETFFDLGMVHLLTTTTLKSLRAHYPAGKFETRRFRPNLVIATTPEEGEFPENNWNEKVLAIGNEVKLKITGTCGRCVMTTLAQGDLPGDIGILKTAVKHNQAQVGAYAAVIQGGFVHKGDAVRIEPA